MMIGEGYNLESSTNSEGPQQVFITSPPIRSRVGCRPRDPLPSKLETCKAVERIFIELTTSDRKLKASREDLE
jgi:hypothetical protein